MSEPRDPILAPDDRERIDALREALDPGKRSPAERAAFAARLEERIPEASWLRPRPAWAALAAAVAVAWMLRPADPVPTGPHVSQSLLSFAYYETDYLADPEAGSGFLSDEYEAIASAFEVR